ncbi:MAG: GDYXXLXY domain-containing protein [Chitinophagales bacterium]|nr:GDYXXLXY domain-containing protein [Chitinophagales bacterium]
MKRSWILAIIVMVVAQLSVPLLMIWNKEQIVKNGATFYLKIRPIDPNHYMKGKYLDLNFDYLFWIKDKTLSNYNTKVYATFIQEENQNLKLDYLDSIPPIGRDDYILLEHMGEDFIIPRSGYFVNENKVEDIEKAVNSWQDKGNIVFAKVKIYKGKMVVMDIIIDEKSIDAVIESTQFHSSKYKDTNDIIQKNTILEKQ